MNFDFNEDITLENEVALLRPLQIADLGNLLPVAVEDKTLLQFSPMAIYSPELLKTYLEKAVSHRANNIRYPFIIFSKRHNQYAGSTSFLNISNPDDRLEIGHTWIGRDFQQTGLNRNCKYLLLNFAFNILGAQRVELKTDERNIASRTAIEKIGGKLEGILRNHMVMSDGFRRNTYMYSILKSEWDVMEPGFLHR